MGGGIFFELEGKFLNNNIYSYRMREHTLYVILRCPIHQINAFCSAREGCIEPA